MKKSVKAKKTNTRKTNILGKETFIKSGVPGLDELLGGGFLEGSIVGVKGGPGTGKSIMSLQFLQEGCKKGEQCLFIVTEGSIEDTKKEAMKVGIDFNSFEKRGLLTFIKEKPTRETLSIAQPLEIIRKRNIKRVVLDNINLFEYTAPSELDFRKNFLHFLEAIKETKVTMLVVVPSDEYGMDMEAEAHDFLFDGLIVLTKVRKGATFERCASVFKMRGQQHLLDIKPFRIEKGGVVVYTKQIPFSLK